MPTPIELTSNYSKFTNDEIIEFYTALIEYYADNMEYITNIKIFELMYHIQQIIDIYTNRTSN